MFLDVELCRDRVSLVRMASDRSRGPTEKTKRRGVRTGPRNATKRSKRSVERDETERETPGNSPNPSSATKRTSETLATGLPVYHLPTGGYNCGRRWSTHPGPPSRSQFSTGSSSLRNSALYGPRRRTGPSTLRNAPDGWSQSPTLPATIRPEITDRTAAPVVGVSRGGALDWQSSWFRSPTAPDCDGVTIRGLTRRCARGHRPRCSPPAALTFPRTGPKSP